ncbi:MAG: PQQ-binding-like beta-propeller repeat protein [Candidatus Woesearchaeota archaeon]
MRKLILINLVLLLITSTLAYRGLPCKSGADCIANIPVPSLLMCKSDFLLNLTLLSKPNPSLGICAYNQECVHQSQSTSELEYTWSDGYSSECWDSCSQAKCSWERAFEQNANQYHLYVWKPSWCAPVNGEARVCKQGNCVSVSGYCSEDQDCEQLFSDKCGVAPNNKGWQPIPNASCGLLAQNALPQQCMDTEAERKAAEAICGKSYAVMCHYTTSACSCVNLSNETFCSKCESSCSSEPPCGDTTCVDACKTPTFTCGNEMAAVPPIPTRNTTCDCCGDGEVQWPNMWPDEEGKGLFREGRWGWEVCDFNSADRDNPAFVDEAKYPNYNPEICMENSCRDDCTCCGDGVLQEEYEECDYTIPSDSPDYIAGCTRNCTLQHVGICVELEVEYEQCVSDQAGWPMYLADIYHTNTNPQANHSDSGFYMAWEQQLNGDYSSTNLVVKNGTLFVLGTNSLRALDTRGNRIWSHTDPDLGNSQTQSPFIYHDTICYVSKSQLTCRHITDGSIAFTLQLGSDMLLNQAPIVSGDILYVYHATGVRAINLSNKKPLWEKPIFRKTSAKQFSATLSTDAEYLFTLESERLTTQSPIDEYRILTSRDASTGQLLWSINPYINYIVDWTILPFNEYSTPTVANGQLFIGATLYGQVYGINDYTGQIEWVWRSKTEDSSIGSPALSNNTLISLSKALGTANPTAYLFRTNYYMSQPFVGSPLNPHYGIELSKYASGVASSTHYFVAVKNAASTSIVAIEISSGESQMIFSIPEAEGTVAQSPVIDSDGNIYLITTKGHIYCLNQEAETVQNSLKLEHEVKNEN